MSEIGQAIETVEKDIPQVESEIAAAAPPVESLVQEIVDFLHKLFPGHGAPGTPTVPPPAETTPPIGTGLPA